jgi:phage FluMu gp28-like protein
MSQRQVKTQRRKERAVAAEQEGVIRFRPYQKPIFMDRTSGLLILHWSRQIGKSFTLAAWAVDRLLTRPGRLVTVLSNSRDNGAEFVVKCEEVCRLLGRVIETEDQSPDLRYENMRFEVRITVGGKTGRIKVLAANPRTARGFSGDLILDEFAFHEDSRAIWEAAEPILSSNQDFLCRIASTGNGKHNMFYEMVTSGDFKVSRVTRTEAWKQGVKVFDPNTREPITPEQARARSRDKRAYDQNYECKFTDENTILLTTDLIASAEREDVGVICCQDWSPEALRFMREAVGDLYLGGDVGRYRDITVLSIAELLNRMFLIRAILRLEGMRLPDQQRRLGVFYSMPKARRAAIDMTGIGLGLVEYSQDEFGTGRVQGVNFSSSVPITDRIRQDGRKQETVRVTEAMATELLTVYEDRRIQHPVDAELRDDLRKPEKVVSPGGRVSIAATRDPKNHADHFWSFALAVEAGSSPIVPFACQRVTVSFGGLNNTPRIGRRKGVLV